MTAAALLDRLQAAGATVSMHGARVHIAAPTGILSPALRAELTIERISLAALLLCQRDTVADPRPDLDDDAARWGRLLALAWSRYGAEPYGLYGTLLGMRCMGVQFAEGANTLRVQPRTDDPGQPPRWVTPAEYREWRPVWLDPHREALIDLLSKAAVDRGAAQ